MDESIAEVPVLTFESSAPPMDESITEVPMLTFESGAPLQEDMEDSPNPPFLASSQPSNDVHALAPSPESEPSPASAPALAPSPDPAPIILSTSTNAEGLPHFEGLSHGSFGLPPDLVSCFRLFSTEMTSRLDVGINRVIQHQTENLNCLVELANKSTDRLVEKSNQETQRLLTHTTQESNRVIDQLTTVSKEHLDAMGQRLNSLLDTKISGLEALIKMDSVGRNMARGLDYSPDQYDLLMRCNPILQKVMFLLKYAIDTKHGVMVMWPFLIRGEAVFVANVYLLKYVARQLFPSDILQKELDDVIPNLLRCQIEMYLFEEDEIQPIRHFFPVEACRPAKEEEERKSKWFGLSAKILGYLFPHVNGNLVAKKSEYRSRFRDWEKKSMETGRSYGQYPQWPLTRTSRSQVYPTKTQQVLTGKVRWGIPLLFPYFRPNVYESVQALTGVSLDLNDLRRQRCHIGPGWILLTRETVREVYYPGQDREGGDNPEDDDEEGKQGQSQQPVPSSTRTTTKKRKSARSERTSARSSRSAKRHKKGNAICVVEDSSRNLVVSPPPLSVYNLHPERRTRSATRSTSASASASAPAPAPASASTPAPITAPIRDWLGDCVLTSDEEM